MLVIHSILLYTEMKTSGEKCQVFNNLNISLKSLCSENKADIELIQRLHKIKRLMLLGDRKTAGELIADLRDPNISDPNISVPQGKRVI